MRQDHVTSLLRGIPLFAELPESGLAELAAIAMTRHYGAGQYVFYQGDPGHALYVIVHGRVQVVLTSDDGGTVILAVLGSGEVFGELALIDGGPRSASVLVAEDAELLTVDRNTLLALLARQPMLLAALLASLGGLIRGLSDRVGDLMFLDLPQRVAKAIVHLVEATQADGKRVVEMPMTQGELASMVGGSRQSVNQILQRFEQRDLLRREGSRITIMDLDALRQRARM